MHLATVLGHRLYLTIVPSQRKHLMSVISQNIHLMPVLGSTPKQNGRFDPMAYPTLFVMHHRYVDIEGSSQAPLVTGHSQNITCLALPQPESQAVMATTAEDGILRIWQMPSATDSCHQVHLLPSSAVLCLMAVGLL